MQGNSAPSTVINLKDAGVAAFLAWLIPGLGHLYQGRYAKAAVFFVCIMGLFLYGVYLSSSNQPLLDGQGTIGAGRAVYFSWRPNDRRWAYLCQIGVGLPAMPALVQAQRMASHRRVWWDGFMAPPWLSEQERQKAQELSVAPNDPNGNFDQPSLQDLYRRLHRYFELAGFYTMIAGLLNILVIYDAWAGPAVSCPGRTEENKGS